MHLLPLLLLAGCTARVLPVDTGLDPVPDPEAVAEHLGSAPGDFALDFLQDGRFDHLVVEIDWVQGRPPDPKAMRVLADTVLDLCDKPGGVDLVYDDVLPDHADRGWTRDELDRFEVLWRSRYRDEASGAAALWILYLDGHLDGDDVHLKRLGTTHHATSIVVFAETLAAMDLGLFTPNLEHTVLRHEFGHVLGLVGQGVPMVEAHEDPEHPAHCDNPRCTMYWLLSTTRAADTLRGLPTTLDAACLQDLTVARSEDRVSTTVPSPDPVCHDAAVHALEAP